MVPGSKSDLAFRLAVRGAFELAMSAEILAEFREKLSSKFGFSEGEIGRVERVILDKATSVEPEVELRVLEDEPDNRILECAMAAGTAAIVTGDRHLLDLKSYEGVGMMTIADLLYSFPR